MKKIRPHLQNQRGETIVEIVVSFMLLLLFTSIFATALRFANNMITKSDELRENAYQLCGKAYPNDGNKDPYNTEDGTAQTYSFVSETLPNLYQFSVESVRLYKLDATVEAADGGETTYTFHRYAAKNEGGTP